MFTRDDSKRINGGIEDIKSKVIRLETSLADHQKAFEKHEMRDDKRFTGLSDDVKVMHEENKEEHRLMRTAINSLQIRLAWLFGIGIAVVTIAEWFLSIYKDAS